MTAHPLAGRVVLEIGHSIAAPYAGHVLAELGARVIKLEPPGRGDDARRWGPPFSGDSATAFHAVNRNKYAIAVDLTDAAQRRAVVELIERDVDVVLHNLRPGSLDKLGLGARSLLERKPSLICCNVGAYGAQGPLADRPGYDPLMQAFSGLMSTLGEEGRPPVRVSVSLIDMATGMWAAIGILAALLERDRTGRGGIVDASLCESALALMSGPIAGFLAGGRVPARLGSGHATIVPTQAFATADGWLMIAAGNDRQFAALATALGIPELASDARFATNADRVRNREALVAALEAPLRTATASHWMERLDAAQVPNGPIQNVAEVVAHPQTEALGILQSPPDAGPRTIGLPLTFDGERPSYARLAPSLGEHTAELLGLPGQTGGHAP